MFSGIKPILHRFSQRRELSVKLDEQRIKKDWQKIIQTTNRQAVGKSEALEVKNKTLIVKVVNNLWLQEMFFYRHELDKKLARYNKDIVSIRFVL